MHLYKGNEQPTNHLRPGQHFFDIIVFYQQKFMVKHTSPARTFQQTKQVNSVQQMSHV